MKNLWFAKTVLSVVSMSAVAVPMMAQEHPGFRADKDVRSIAITATSHVTNMADVATVHVGFEAWGADKDAAYAAGSKVSNDVMAALKKAGVPSEAIQSENQQVQPTPPYELNQMDAVNRSGKAFHVTQSWTVRANAEDGAKILDLATKAGANNGGSIDWSLRDPNAASTAAAAKALKAAQGQAEAMAAGLGVKLNGLLFASNQVDEQPVRPVMRAMAAPMAMKQEAVAPLAVNPREIETSATVYAVFAIQ